MEQQLINQILNGDICFKTVLDKLQVCDFRKKLYKRLSAEFSQKHGELIRELFKIEIKERKLCVFGAVVEESKIDDTYDCPWSIRCCAYLLYKLADLNDVKLIWQAKTIDYDSYFELDGQLLVGAGVNETIDFLKKKRGRIAKFIIKDNKRY